MSAECSWANTFMAEHEAAAAPLTANRQAAKAPGNQSQLFRCELTAGFVIGCLAAGMGGVLDLLMPRGDGHDHSIIPSAAASSHGRTVSLSALAVF